MLFTRRQTVTTASSKFSVSVLDFSRCSYVKTWRLYPEAAINFFDRKQGLACAYSTVTSEVTRGALTLFIVWWNRLSLSRFTICRASFDSQCWFVDALDFVCPLRQTYELMRLSNWAVVDWMSVSQAYSSEGFDCIIGGSPCRSLYFYRFSFELALGVWLHQWVYDRFAGFWRWISQT